MNGDKKASKKRGRSKKDDTDDEDGSDDGSDDQKPKAKKPRIRIRVSSSAKKGKATPEKAESGGGKKSRRSTPRRSPGDGSDEEVDEMFDVEALESEHDNLEGTWEAARDFATKLGPWRLPTAIESSFKDIAKIALFNLSK